MGIVTASAAGAGWGKSVRAQSATPMSSAPISRRDVMREKVVISAFPLSFPLRVRGVHPVSRNGLRSAGGPWIDLSPVPGRVTAHAGAVAVMKRIHQNNGRAYI